MIINTEYRNGMYMFDSTGCLYEYMQTAQIKWFKDYYRNSKTVIDERILVTNTKLYLSEQEYFWENQWKIFPLQDGDILQDDKGDKVRVIKIGQAERSSLIIITYVEIQSRTVTTAIYNYFIEEYKIFVE